MATLRASDAGWALLAAAGIALKLCLPGAPPADQPSAVSEAFGGFLRDRGFSVSASELLPGIPAIVGSAAGCRLEVTHVVSQGWHREVVGNLAGPDDSVIFVVDGVAHRRQPLLWTWFDFYRARLARSVHIPVRSHPVAAVIASPACHLIDIAWPNVTLYE